MKSAPCVSRLPAATVASTAELPLATVFVAVVIIAVVAATIAPIRSEAGDADERTMVSGAKRIVIGTVLNMHKSLTSGTKEDEAARFRRRIAD